MKRRTQNKLRRLFYTSRRSRLFTAENKKAVGDLAEITSGLFKGGKKGRRH